MTDEHKPGVTQPLVTALRAAVTAHERQKRHTLARAPFAVTRRWPGKSWAGALVSNLDDAFGIGRKGRGLHGLDFSDTSAADLHSGCCDV